MRTIDMARITETVSNLCSAANKQLPADIVARLAAAAAAECQPLARELLLKMIDNAALAEQMDIPICQDTGLVVVFADVGQEVSLRGVPFEEAINAGVAHAYTNDCLRCSITADPLRRGNTGDNTPAVIHTRIVPGDKLSLTVSPKGCGSENMSAICMLKPTATRSEVIEAVCGVARRAGSNPCPPMIIGVGLGGNFESSALLAKRALCRALDSPHPDADMAALESELLQAVNALGIGVQGFGGDTTALGINVERAPTHIAGLPVAVNIGCYVTRHKSAVL